MKKKILIIQHHGKFGGASKSISEFILNLKKRFDFHIACQKGTTYDYFIKNNFKVFKFFGIPSYDITEIGKYSGFRKILLIREIFYFITSFIYLLNLKKNKYDIIHLNDSNLIICAPLLKYFFKSKIICHIRTRIDKKIPFLISYISTNYIDKFICIDKTTYSTSPLKKKTVIIYNIFKREKNKKILRKNFFYVGFLGSLDFHKGLDFYFDCISEINKFNNNFIFLIGGTLSISNGYLMKLLTFLKIKKDFNQVFEKFKKKKFKNVKFLNKVTNLGQFYNSINLICFPSRMNALGRPVIEAAAYGIPSLVCLNNYYNDTIIDNKTGYVVKFGNIKKFIKKLTYLNRNKNKLKQLGIHAKKNYNLRHNSINNFSKLSKLYISLK